MPIYEYACDTCHSTFERKQKFSEDPVRECPDCGSSVRRVFHPAGIIFKGSGFYVTDNRATNGASASSNGTSTSTSESSGTGSKSESTASSTSSSAAAES